MDTIKKESIGGWLWALMGILIVYLSSSLVDIFTHTNYAFHEEWRLYTFTFDSIITWRINLNIFSIISSLGTLALSIWALIYFFTFKKQFINLFTGFLCYLFYAEVVEILLLEHYASIANQNPVLMDTSLTIIGEIYMLTGFYLNKGKRPQRTFVR